MQMPVAVGVIIVVMFLVTFSGWFYNYALGMQELVLDDRYFTYRIAVASLASAVFFVLVFFAISVVNQCPNEERAGIFSGLKCESYLKLKANADSLFQPKNETINQTL